jgi:hypothetical protein
MPDNSLVSSSVSSWSAEPVDAPLAVRTLTLAACSALNACTWEAAASVPPSAWVI